MWGERSSARFAAFRAAPTARLRVRGFGLWHALVGRIAHNARREAVQIAGLTGALRHRVIVAQASEPICDLSNLPGREVPGLPARPI